MSTISKSKNRFLLEFGLLFFLILSIPYDQYLFLSLANGSLFSFENAFQWATYRTSFVIEGAYVGSDVRGYYNWLIALGVALVLVIAFGKYFRKRYQVEEHTLYYWLRVLLRYRLALAITFTGIVKVLPIQIPEPTLSDLHTEYGDFLRWKLYYLTNGIATAGYLPLIGALEVIAGLLLLHRRTAVIGAGVLVAILLNVVIVNYVYDIGEQVYSSFLLLIASVIFLYDLPRFYGLLVNHGAVLPDVFVPRFSPIVWRARPYLQIVFLLLIAGFSVQAYVVWKHTNYPFPEEKGVAKWKGLYDVKDFVWNGDTLAYSLTDEYRWKDVVFEAWNSISIRDNFTVKADSLKPRISTQNARNYEYLGNGGRRFYRYTYRKVEKNKPAQLNLNGQNDADKHFNFLLDEVDPVTLVLRGRDEAGNTLQVRLERQAKNYLLHEGRRKPIRIY
ncbi:beta-carotene 15,15'-monooxygenase [Sphingobacterium sp. lm-10]|uniref:beta-carotene 15,15'-monooxygenase n=1 Tax=Sphingobacterium sp. lm-10 TaxID=2944904 RepID=UPI00201FD684|nr:beta-carotene 15,15'-monooxygenase [Sphingobacterium sp. lm-10]MCL7987641.1 beta-carotene 15,15'-monooxygenase [Sphingobacterium sp. lm-10]